MYLKKLLCHNVFAKSIWNSHIFCLLWKILITFDVLDIHTENGVQSNMSARTNATVQIKPIWFCHRYRIQACDNQPKEGRRDIPFIIWFSILSPWSTRSWMQSVWERCSGEHYNSNQISLEFHFFVILYKKKNWDLKPWLLSLK